MELSFVNDSCISFPPLRIHLSPSEKDFSRLDFNSAHRSYVTTSGGKESASIELQEEQQN